MFLPEGSTSAIYVVPLRHKGPCGKACYGSAGAARRSITALKRNGKDRKYEGYLHAYVCPECRAWHVGHTAYEDQ